MYWLKISVTSDYRIILNDFQNWLPTARVTRSRIKIKHCLVKVSVQVSIEEKSTFQIGVNFIAFFRAPRFLDMTIVSISEADNDMSGAGFYRRCFTSIGDSSSGQLNQLSFNFGSNYIEIT